jgi:hypothetical protein
LFGKLVTEWIKQLNPETPAKVSSHKRNQLGTEMSDSFEAIGRKEMHEQREQWESYAFTERKMDQGRIQKYLNDQKIASPGSARFNERGYGFQIGTKHTAERRVVSCTIQPNRIVQQLIYY